jgi:hypothetical protein
LARARACARARARTCARTCASACVCLPSSAAFGIFGRLQVTNFNFDFSRFFLCHFIFSFLFSVVCCLYCVSSTERQLMPALNVLFRNQVIQANQFFFSALWPSIL